MSKATTNYGLILEDDASTKFKDWREAINGATNSNFIEVDRILAEKGNKSASVECTLVASSWVGVDAPFTQELVVTGLGSVQNGNILSLIAQLLSSVRQPRCQTLRNRTGRRKAYYLS